MKFLWLVLGLAFSLSVREVRAEMSALSDPKKEKEYSEQLLKVAPSQLNFQELEKLFGQWEQDGYVVDRKQVRLFREIRSKSVQNGHSVEELTFEIRYTVQGKLVMKDGVDYYRVPQAKALVSAREVCVIASLSCQPLDHIEFTGFQVDWMEIPPPGGGTSSGGSH